jgi:3-oxoacyl-[acyl-carrier protein] reductase
MSRLAGKVAIVTGASRGIGRAIAERLAGDGAAVVVNYANSPHQAAEVVSLIQARGGVGMAVHADMSVIDEVRQMFQQARDWRGRFDILINNAAVAVFKPLIDITEDEYDRTFALNTKGAFFALQEAARRISDHGRIINISTGGTASGLAAGSIYCASKAALEQFTKSLARELGPREVTVNTVSPGITDTAMARGVPGLVERGAGLSPLGRLGQPADVADVVAFICSDEARWLTGQNIQAGGGVTIY